MAMITRQVEVDWVGSLADGTGTLSPGSRAFEPLPVTWASRTELPDGRTSSEELLAAAHASSFAMSLCSVLHENQTPAEHLMVATACSLDELEDNPRISSVHLNVRAWVPLIDADRLETLVERAGERCPLSNALRGNVEIYVQCLLEQEADRA